MLQSDYKHIQQGKYFLSIEISDISLNITNITLIFYFPKP
jgi:hypothetical protein